MATALPPGIYVPMPTFFLSDSETEQSVDVDTVARHVKYLCSAGVHGIVCMGSTGEAVHLSDEERQLVLRTARKTIDETSSKVKLLAGCANESVCGTLKLITQAAEAGAEYAMVLPPSYYLAWANRNEVIYTFYTTVADKSPLPIVIYNFPGVCQQIDIPQELIVKLSEHPKIVGIKCTDGNVGKAVYVCGHIDRNKFTVLSGSAENFIPFMTAGAQGCVPGFGNIAPRIMCELFNLYQSHSREQWGYVKDLQSKVVVADHAFFRWGGIAGLKAALQHELGYGGLPRLPLLPVADEQVDSIVKALESTLKIERQLAAKSSEDK